MLVINEYIQYISGLNFIPLVSHVSKCQINFTFHTYLDDPAKTGTWCID